MRVILASQGFTTDEIEKEVAIIVGKPAKLSSTFRWNKRKII